ncbi:hypothetical protein SAMN05216382_2686 [Sphingomonas palmae]|uniref:Uncharacterized protein n=1 Tax=Sphingomonas palmae TaxID=1855283 RepID=A0A1H7T6X2_9SPHN|nr:hypothetical protein [Sphingomonas palmae]SEL80523.1 hypothetical protein SAMN05216382_2686 [Sphingomonas palmae]
MTDRSDEGVPGDAAAAKDGTGAGAKRCCRESAGSGAARNQLETSPAVDVSDGDVVAAREQALGVVGLPWLAALKDLMGPTASGPGTTHFAWGLREDRLSWGDLKVFAERLQQDVVFLEFEDPLADCPPRILVAIRGKKVVTLFEECELWVLNHWTKVEIITPSRRFKLDDHGRLKGKPNNLDEMRARRVSLTHQRWKALAAELAATGLTGWRVIPRELFSPAAATAEVLKAP